MVWGIELVYCRGVVSLIDLLDVCCSWCDFEVVLIEVCVDYVIVLVCWEVVIFVVEGEF